MHVRSSPLRPAGAYSAPDRPVLRAPFDEHQGSRGRAERRLHARWRQPALVTECHPVLGPTSRKTPTRRGLLMAGPSRPGGAEPPVMAWLVALPIWAHDVGCVPVARWAGRHLPLALPFGGPGELQVQRGCSCTCHRAAGAPGVGSAVVHIGPPGGGFLAEGDELPAADRTGGRTVCF